MNEYTIEGVLEKALGRLNRQSSFDMYLDYIRSEWYASVADLILALEDGKAWSDLKLPGRLKLEIKSELLNIQTALKLKSVISGTISAATTIPGDANVEMTAKILPADCWTKCFSAEHNDYFYYNTITDESAWELPEGVICAPMDAIFLDKAESGDASKRWQQYSDEQSSNKLIDASSNCNGGHPSTLDTAASNKSGANNSSAEASHKSNMTAHSHDREILAQATPVTAVAIAVGIVDSRTDSRDDLSYESDLGAMALRRSFMSSGANSVEESSSGSGDENDDQDSTPDPDMVRRLTEMGFDHTAVVKALVFTENNITAAASYLLARKDSARLRAPPTAPPRREGSATADLLRRMGVQRAFPPTAPPPPTFNGQYSR